MSVPIYWHSLKGNTEQFQFLFPPSDLEWFKGRPGSLSS